MNSDIKFSEKIISGQTSLKLNSVDSTNNFLEELLQKETIKDRFVVQTDYQTAGKGMLQNSWQSHAGSNLLFSLYCRHENLKVADQFYLSKAISIGISKYLNTIFSPNKVKIKWPNDILVSEKKIGGVLIKCSVRSELVQYSIIGIGLNVNQLIFPEHFIATSMNLENGRDFDVNLVLENLLEHLDLWLEKLQKRDFKEINETYHSNLFGFESFQKYQWGENVIEAKILEVTEDGRVILEDKNGHQTKFEVKEIALVSR